MKRSTDSDNDAGRKIPLVASDPSRPIKLTPNQQELPAPFADEDCEGLLRFEIDIAVAARASQEFGAAEVRKHLKDRLALPAVEGPD